MFWNLTSIQFNVHLQAFVMPPNLKWFLCLFAKIIQRITWLLWTWKLPPQAQGLLSIILNHLDSVLTIFTPIFAHGFMVWYSSAMQNLLLLSILQNEHQTKTWCNPQSLTLMCLLKEWLPTGHCYSGKTLWKKKKHGFQKDSYSSHQLDLNLGELHTYTQKKSLWAEERTHNQSKHGMNIYQQLLDNSRTKEQTFSTNKIVLFNVLLILIKTILLIEKERQSWSLPKSVPWKIYFITCNPCYRVLLLWYFHIVPN